MEKSLTGPAFMGNFNLQKKCNTADQLECGI